MRQNKLSFQFRALTIACSDVKRSAHFYEKVLGATIVPTDNGVGWWYRLGIVEITLFPNAAEPSPANFPTHAMPILWLETENLEAAAKRFKQFGVDVIDPGDGQFMIVADPDGILIEVWEKPK